MCRCWMAGLLLALLLVSCGREASWSGPTEERLAELEAAFFDEELKPCTSSEECSSGHCDLTPVYTISVSAGYCVTFPSAFERWQKVELADRLADYVRRFPGLAERVEARLAREYLDGDRAGDLETAYLVLAGLGSESAVARLAVEYETRTGTVREVAGLALAEAGDRRGLDAVVDAAFSPVVRVRMHAARAAGGLCSEASGRVLAELLDDASPLVAEAAASAMGRCPGANPQAFLEGQKGFAAKSARLAATGEK